ncbi:hypothetical protein Bca52824_036752 [Brassica carinata]|uniref:Uncharacterized protein n=1 Tax=Brassica carinata TaxID=52824 RepID=A0A8X7S7R7_BRACI|nr:hypothetical protein Bca52824_036752 [Brassica carinata]
MDHSELSQDFASSFSCELRSQLEDGLLEFTWKSTETLIYLLVVDTWYASLVVVGRYIRGAPLVDKTLRQMQMLILDVTVEINSGEAISALAIAGHKGDSLVSSGPSLRARFVGKGYKHVCGRADMCGDGVVPEVSAHLEGALNLSFNGVYHSPVGSDEET